MYEIQDEIQLKIKKEFKKEFKVGCDGESIGREMRFIAVMFSSKYFVCVLGTVLGYTVRYSSKHFVR